MWKNSIYNFFTTFENNDKEEPQQYYLFCNFSVMQKPLETLKYIGFKGVLHAM